MFRPVLRGARRLPRGKRLSPSTRRAAVAGLALGLALAAVQGAQAASLITGVQLTVEARGSIPARPAPWSICAGEVLHVEVTAQHPLGAGYPVAVAIDGAVGNERFLQFFGDPGFRRITVTAETEQGDLETVTQEIKVGSCAVNDLPMVRGRVNPYHPGSVDFTVEGGNFGPDFTAYHWDFGDGSTAATTETYVSHDYAAALDGRAPYHSLIVQVSGQPISGGVPAPGSLVRRYALTMMDSYWFSKRQGILQPPATSGVVLERRGTQLVGSYSIRNLEADALVFQYAELEELPCEAGIPSKRAQILPSDVIFQGGYGVDLNDPDLQGDPGFRAAMELKESIAWLPKDAWVVPPVVMTTPKGTPAKSVAEDGQTEPAGLEGQADGASTTTATPVFPPIPPPIGAESGFVVIPPEHVHEGYLTVDATKIDPGTCNLAYHLVGESVGGGRAYVSLYFEARENPALTSEVKDKDLGSFLKKLLDRGLASDPAFISHEDLYRLEQEGKIRRTPAGWEVI
jgi:hypothetical protein